MINEVLFEREFQTFQNFWYHISPLGDIGKKLSGFIFRGEDSDKYKLLPILLRKDYVEQYEVTSAYNEIVSLCQFYKEANINGLRVPNNKILQGDTPERIIGNGMFWYSSDFEETAALAQHYKIPTRLLDWTKDMFTAFYFASIGVLKIKHTHKKTDCFAIYALNYEYLTKVINNWRCHEKSTNRKPFPIKFVIPHYSDNPNVYAQNGILSYSEIDIDPISHRERITDATPLDEKLLLVAENKEYYHGIPHEGILLYKFILPKSEALNMFSFISRLNYSHSRLFPGYAGIMKTLEEKRLIEAYFEGNPHP